MLKASVLRSSLLLRLLPFMVLAAGTGFFMAEVNYDLKGLVLVATVIGILAIFIIPRLTLPEAENFLLRVLVCGLFFKLGFSILRLWVSFNVYGGVADVSGYHSSGIVIAQHLRQLEFDQIVPFLQLGTNFIKFFTGVVYSVIGPTIYGGYFIYASLAFLGSYYFYRTFRVAFPNGNKRLYAILVFFLPSILFWPNGISKDALIFLCIGLFAYGGAQLTQDRLRGLVPLTLGLLGTLCIRPHIAAMLALSFVFAILFRGVGKRSISFITFVIGIIAIGGVVWFLLPRAMVYVGMEEFSPEGILSTLQIRQNLTYQGGSAFQVGDISDPLTFPMTMSTILFRPFPWEAHNLQALIQSLEGVLLMGLILWRIKSLGKAVVSSISNIYLRYILVFIISFTIAFSVISNFGLLARQRAMVLPFFLMLIAYAGPVARTAGKPNVVSVV